MKCPYCGSEAIKLTDTEHHCEACNKDFEVNEKKVQPKPDGSGRIKKIEEDLAYLRAEHEKLKKETVGDDFFGL